MVVRVKITECIGLDNLDWFIEKYKLVGEDVRGMKNLVATFITIFRLIEEDEEVRKRIMRILVKKDRKLARVARKILYK